MAVILNIETSTEVCSVNVARDGRVLFEKEHLEGMRHSELLTVFIGDLLRENKLKPSMIDAVAVSKGPGSYTGLRIGVSVAKGLCYALGKPLIAISTLDAMGDFVSRHATTFLPPGKIGEAPFLFCPMIDARRMEVYSAVYNGEGKVVEPVAARIIDEKAFPELLAGHRVLFFGNGATKCQQVLSHPNALFSGPLKASARFMLHLAEEKFATKGFEDVAYFEPYYLKDFIATVPKNKIIS